MRSAERMAAPPRIGPMNPRYRRLLIPGALVGLLLIVVIAALVK